MFELPPALSDSEADQIIQRIQEGRSTDNDRQRLINGNLRMVFVTAIKTLKKAKFHEKWCDDFSDSFNSGVVGLIEAIDNLIKGKHEINGEYYKYLVKTVSHRCREEIHKKRLMNVPQRTLRHFLSKGLNKTRVTTVELNNADISIQAKCMIALLPPMYQYEMVLEARKLSLAQLRKKIRTKLFELTIFGRAAIVDDEDEVEEGQICVILEMVRHNVSLELKEALQRSVHTLEEQTILNYRKENMTYQEIADKCHMSRPNVKHIVSRIEKRFDGIWNR
jgi:RNA polymerase sigma factor (sigma-70 family)